MRFTKLMVLAVLAVFLTPCLPRAAEFHIAHIRIGGQDIVVFPLKSEFQWKNERDQLEIHAFLQACSLSAGLAGRVVLAWVHGGRFHFRAPEVWHPFFRNVDYQWVLQQINRTLRCA